VTVAAAKTSAVFGSAWMAAAHWPASDRTSGGGKGRNRCRAAQISTIRISLNGSLGAALR